MQALSWYISKHSAGIYSGTLPETPWTPSPGRASRVYPRAHVVAAASGKATVESYSVVHDRDNRPQEALVIGRERSGNRFIAKLDPHAAVLEKITETEIIGTSGNVEYDATAAINWFHPD